MYPSDVEEVVEDVGVTESGRSAMTEVAADNSAIDDPFALVATTETFMYLPMSPSVRTYVLFVAEAMFEYVPLAVVARFH